MNLRVVSLLGLGNVGQMIGQLLLHCSPSHYIINVVDPSGEIDGTYLDLSHSTALYPGKSVELNNMDLLGESDIIFHCAGSGVPSHGDRLSIARENTELAETIFKPISWKSTAIVIVVSNPVDIITYTVQRATGLPESQIIGTGTFLDSIRLDASMNQNSRSNDIYKNVVIGEHGSSMVHARSLSTINGKKLDENVDSKWIDACLDQTIHAAKTIKKTQGATYHAVSACAIRLFQCIEKNAGEVIPVSRVLTDEHQLNLGCKPIALSLPCSIGTNGATPTSLSLTEEELVQLKKSAHVIETVQYGE